MINYIAINWYFIIQLLACLSKSLGDLWPNDFKIPVPLPTVVWFISRLNEQLRKCGKTVRTGSKQHRLLYNVQQDYDKVYIYNVHVSTCMYMYVHVHTCMCLWLNVHLYMYMYLQVCTCTCTYVSMTQCAFVHVRVHVSMYMYMCVLYTL